MKKNIKKYILLGAVFLGLGSCSHFDELNTNPDAATTVSSEMLATNLIYNITVSSIDNTKGFLQPFLLSKSLNYTEFAEAYQYNNLGKQGFGGLVVLTNVEKMINLSPEGAIKNSFTGLGKFVRAWKFYELTMRVGDIPYTDALQGENGVIAPEYSTQKEVFAGILKELDEADQLFAQGTNFGGDFIYGGNVTKWRKLVNTFALKVLLTLSAKEGDADLNVKSRFNTIVTSRPVFESNADNFQVVYSNVDGQRYPFHKLGNQFVVYPMMSSMIVDRLKDLEDYRLFYYAEASAVKTGAGISSSSYDAYVGVDPSRVYSEISAISSSKDYSNFNLRYTELPNTEPVYLLSYSMLQFMLSEAALRGWVGGTPAGTYYENGIRAAMKFVADNTPDNASFHHNRKITDDYIASYLASGKVKLSGTTEQQLEKILTQRYLANFMQAPYDGFFENRRTGYPVFPVNPASNANTQSDKMPVRWMYPDAEVSYNNVNVTKAIQSQFNGNDDFNEKMWLLK